MKLTIGECLEKWAGTELAAPKGKEKGCILMDTKTKEIINFPESREILVALVVKAGGRLTV